MERWQEKQAGWERGLQFFCLSEPLIDAASYLPYRSNINHDK